MNVGTFFKLIAFVGLAVAAYFLIRHGQEIRKFLDEVVAELKKVSWTPRQDLINATLVVITSAICLGLFITTVDLIVSRGLNAFLR